METGAHHISSDYPTPGTYQSEGYFLNFNSPYKILCNPITTNSRNPLNSYVSCSPLLLEKQYSTNSSNAHLIIIIFCAVAVAVIIFMIFQSYKSKKWRRFPTKLEPERSENHLSSCCKRQEDGEDKRLIG